MTAMGAPQRTRSIASSDFIPNFSLFLSLNNRKEKTCRNNYPIPIDRYAKIRKATLFMVNSNPSLGNFTTFTVSIIIPFFLYRVYHRYSQIIQIEMILKNLFYIIKSHIVINIRIVKHAYIFKIHRYKHVRNSLHRVELLYESSFHGSFNPFVAVFVKPVRLYFPDFIHDSFFYHQGSLDSPPKAEYA